jgi:hypothetical protein
MLISATLIAFTFWFLIALSNNVADTGRAMGPLTLIVKGRNGEPDCTIGPGSLELKQCETPS